MTQPKRCNCTDIAENTIHKYASLVINNKKVMMVKKKSSGELIFLGGKHEDNESAEECLEREAKEELNVEVKNLEYLGRFKDVTSAGIPLVEDTYIVEMEGSIKLREEEIAGIVWIDRNYKRKGLSLTKMGENQIIPELIRRNLI